jgi:3-methyl-2-oxobutanoate hydroxymethyltransferase
MVEMGWTTTRAVTIEHMCYHVGAVRRGAPATHIIGDMPYLTDADPETALRNARRLIDAGADSVKLEGPKYDVIAHLVAAGIPVAGHTGLTPQTAQSMKQVGRDQQDAERVLREALGIAGAGAFLIVLEHIPATLAETITGTIAIPTIGIGAGAHCDGQVMVINDAIGLGDYWPPFSKQYAHISKTIQAVAESFAVEVRQRIFPGGP